MENAINGPLRSSVVNYDGDEMSFYVLETISPGGQQQDVVY